MVDDALPGMPVSRWVTLARPGAVDLRTHWVDFGGPAAAGGPSAPPTIVCVHGLGGSVIDWMRLAPALTMAARVVALDLVGHGRSPGPRGQALVPVLREQLDAFMREVVGGPAVLIGNSMGGVVSLLEATAAPALVSGLVLVDPALPVPRTSRPDPYVALAFTTYLIPRVAEWAAARRRKRLSPEGMVRQTLGLCAAHLERIPDEFIQSYVALNIERSGRDDTIPAFLESARSLLALMLARPRALRTALRAISAPTLLLHGARDRLVPVRAAQSALALRPDWTLEIHPDAGHIPMVEEPGWTAERILAWLPTDAARVDQPARPAPERTSAP